MGMLQNETDWEKLRSDLRTPENVKQSLESGLGACFLSAAAWMPQSLRHQYMVLLLKWDFLGRPMPDFYILERHPEDWMLDFGKLVDCKWSEREERIKEIGICEEGLDNWKIWNQRRLKAHQELLATLEFEHS